MEHLCCTFSSAMLSMIPKFPKSAVHDDGTNGGRVSGHTVANQAHSGYAEVLAPNCDAQCSILAAAADAMARDGRLALDFTPSRVGTTPCSTCGAPSPCVPPGTQAGTSSPTPVSVPRAPTLPSPPSHT